MNAPRLVSLALVAVTVAGCATSATPRPSPSPSPSAAPSPTSSDFAVDVIPVQEPVEARVAIPGEKVSFLVTVASDDGSPVQIAATATGAKIIDIRPVALAPGVVGEVWLVPDPTDIDATVSLAITASRGATTRTVQRTVQIMPMPDERAGDAQKYFDLWIDYLATSHPELGITSETKWEPTFVSTFLVVSHYAYYSDEWELLVSWHNMIAPYDWTEVYLRHRGTDTKPSLDFKIDSVSGKTTPYATTPPEAVMR
jgi:hypothetical protein